MSVRVVNGKVVMNNKPAPIDAPTPSQIAERAYELAIVEAVKSIEGYDFYNEYQKQIRDYMKERQAAALAALRESVINPGVIPWWRKAK